MAVTYLWTNNRTKVAGKRAINLVVIHDMEAPELDGTAEAVAAYFQKPGTRASAHECVDNNSVVVGVPDNDVAWAAPGANHDGLQFELAGYARQTRKQWADPYSDALLHLAARRVARKCETHDIPVRFRDAADLRAGGARRRGITTHAQVTLAHHQSTHTDPGPNFPMLTFLGMVTAASHSLDLSDLQEAYRADSLRRKTHPKQVRRLQRALGMRTQSGRYGPWTKKAATRMFGHPQVQWEDLKAIAKTTGIKVYK